jgi:hypothetical protein
MRRSRKVGNKNVSLVEESQGTVCFEIKEQRSPKNYKTACCKKW